MIPKTRAGALTVGVISDTHGLLRPEAASALEGSSLIVHAGDIGKPEVLTALQRLAPVHAIRGNVDTGPWTRDLPATRVVEVEGHALYVLHNLDDLDLAPEAAGFSAVIYGHSHKPKVEEVNGVLYLNPGSAGPRRFRLPTTISHLRVGQHGLEPKLVHLPA